MELSRHIVRAKSETEAALLVLGHDLDDIIFHKSPEDRKKCRIKMTIGPEKITEDLQFLYDNYKIIYKLNKDSVFLVQTKHKMAELTYNLKEPLKIIPPLDIINIFRYAARRIGKNIYEVIETYTLKENQSITLASYIPKV